MLRQEIADKEELAELSQNEMEIAKQREIEQKDEIQKIRSQLLKARLDQDEIDELRTKGRLNFGDYLRIRFYSASSDS